MHRTSWDGPVGSARVGLGQVGSSRVGSPCSDGVGLGRFPTVKSDRTSLWQRTAGSVRVGPSRVRASSRRSPVVCGRLRCSVQVRSVRRVSR